MNKPVGLPLLLRLSNRDPHVAAGPMVLAVSDLFTLLLYFLDRAVGFGLKKRK